MRVTSGHKAVFVLPHGNGWAVREEGCPHLDSVHRTQSQALLVGLEAAGQRDGRLIVLGQSAIAIVKGLQAESVSALKRYDALN